MRTPNFESRPPVLLRAESDSTNAIANFEFDVALPYVKGERQGRKVHHCE